MSYPPATVNNRRNARSRRVCPDHVPCSMRVNRSWETLSNASAMAEQLVKLVKYSNAMRYIHNGSGIDAHLPSESLCLFLCRLPVVRIYCYRCSTRGPPPHADGAQTAGCRGWINDPDAVHSGGPGARPP